MLPKINSIMITILLLMQFVFLYAIVKQQEQVYNLIAINNQLRTTIEFDLYKLKNMFFVGNHYE